MPDPNTNDNAPESAETVTPRHALASKVLILGLDGATWDVMRPLMNAGRMPNLKRIVDQGTSGVLRSTVPPITPAAWTTFMTGKGPGTHGIIDFERYDVHTNGLSFNTTNALKSVASIWQILGDKGYKVGSLNVPMTYPPIPVNGFLISGFEAVSTSSDFAYPPELKDDILKHWPDYTFKNKWRRSNLRPGKVYAENLDQITNSFHTGAELVEHCGEKYGWDVLMIVYKLVDNLQHKAWRYLDPRTRDNFPSRRRMAENCFVELDTAIGRIMQYAQKHQAHIFVMSDHGHGSLEGKAQPNLMLHKWGYLNLREGGAQAKTRARHSVSRIFRKKGKFAAGNFSLEDDLAIDFANTKAAVMHAGMSGFLYINLKGRQQTGIVDPQDYENLRDELIQRFQDATCQDPTGATVKIFDAVHKPEELYGCDRAGREWLPDLLLIPRNGLAAVRKIRGSSFVKWIPLHRMEGTHRPNGVWAVHGPGVVAGKQVDTDIINSTPTILAMMGLPIPDDMEGRVVEDAFSSPLNWTTEAATQTTTQSGDGAKEVYSPEDMAKLTERLADLGYLE